MYKYVSAITTRKESVWQEFLESKLITQKEEVKVESPVIEPVIDTPFFNVNEEAKIEEAPKTEEVVNLFENDLSPLEEDLAKTTTFNNLKEEIDKHSREELLEEKKALEEVSKAQDELKNATSEALNTNESLENLKSELDELDYTSFMDLGPEEYRVGGR